MPYTGWYYCVLVYSDMELEATHATRGLCSRGGEGGYVTWSTRTVKPVNQPFSFKHLFFFQAKLIPYSVEEAYSNCYFDVVNNMKTPNYLSVVVLVVIVCYPGVAHGHYYLYCLLRLPR